MAGEDSLTLKWTNGKKHCKVIFVTDDKIFLLFRPFRWKASDIYNCVENKIVQLDVKEGRRIWELLVKSHNFKEIDIADE
jgi:hypothetical protein